MTTHTNTTVTPSMRFRANDLIRQLNKEGLSVTAMIVDRACFWESFPNSYSDEQVQLAQQLLMTDYGTEDWHLLATAILIVIQSK